MPFDAYAWLVTDPEASVGSAPLADVLLLPELPRLIRLEYELLSHLVTGADTKDLARLMFLPGHTVQDHLKSKFAKTSARNRRTLLSRALGT